MLLKKKTKKPVVNKAVKSIASLMQGMNVGVVARLMHLHQIFV